MDNKILIVEDEFVVANDLRLILLNAGYRVIGIANSAERAEGFVRKDKPDIVLLDIRLEGKKTGIDIARKLRDENIAFVYLSAHSNQKILEEAKATNPQGFLVKPFREKDLLVALDIAWYRHRNELESRLQQRELLQSRLMKLVDEVRDRKDFLLLISRVLQSFIPFDLMMMGSRPFDGGTFNDMGYARTGFDEYQFIGDKELVAIAGVKAGALSAITDEANPDDHPVLYTRPEERKAGNVSLQKILFDGFKLVAGLDCPISLAEGQSIRYSFYTRQPDLYNQHHLALLSYVKPYLTELTYRMDRGNTRMADKPVRTGKTIDHDPGFKDIIGKSPLLVAALDLVVQVAPFNTSVLILGETGTGKEKVAKSIHLLSGRRDGPFVKVNCAAIPVTLVESELFGHEKGAFTGAIEKRKGKFEQAEGGTIFLDEIGEMPLDIQVKLLRVLQEREIESVGGSSARKVNVRIVAATNRNLEKEVANGRFRMDLYYRLCVFPITLPPLRQRKNDIPDLAFFFAQKFCNEFDRPFVGIGISMVREMLAYDWPGNIRELENIIEQSVILNDGKSALELKRSLKLAEIEISGKIKAGTSDDAKQIQRETEKEYIISVLKKTSGRIRGEKGAAELLNVIPTTLESKIARLGIQKEDYTDSGEHF